MDLIERPGTLVEQVLLALTKEITTRRLAPGSKLPSEQELATQLGVSRPVVREAISRLKADAVLVTRKGSGAYVAENPTGNVFRLPAGNASDHNLEHLFELRCWTEIAAAEAAALRRSANDVKVMQAALKRMKASAGEFDVASTADVDFHKAIAGATRNPYLLSFLEFIGGQLLEAREIAWQNSAKLAQGASPALAEHEAIFEAIKSGAPAQARRAATVHLLAAGRRMRLDVEQIERTIGYQSGADEKEPLSAHKVPRHVDSKNYHSSNK